MQPSISQIRFLGKPRIIGLMTFALFLLCTSWQSRAQDTPLLSGGGGFFTNTTGGNTNYQFVIEPLLAAPVGKHFLIESRAYLDESYSPKGDGQSGYSGTGFIALTYLQGSYFLSPHVTVTGGSFLLPFNTYNDRLSPIWISNFQDGPLISSLGTLSTGTGLGGMLAGSAVSKPKYSIDYKAWFSARSGNEQFDTQRSAGARASLYLPEKRLEVGLSYDKQLQGVREHFYGAHAWWEPANTAFRLRSEFARGFHAQGYWIEADYRTQAFGGLNSWIGRFEPLFRIQQSFRRDTIASDGLPLVNTQRADFGLDYNLLHSTRIITSYSRQFASTGDENIWETGIVYRFLFPAWKAR
ncbi:hypothetical protein ACFPT7_08725 [Acidicapsa dinghuensis]|uniref:DUF2219 family protein n=1 Tax=Acidicapsa dinghuensis TaxID=2218256 RepID=A0ABW1EDE4_9BACT|nr:hypothetical protein [Acidicapsa dinghuensis]